MSVQSISSSLLHALRYDDANEFRAAMENDSGHWEWPRDSSSSDYQLLMKAVRLGRKRIANLLLDMGAEVFKNASKTTPLHQAVLLVGWGGVIEKMLKLGAKVGIQNCRGDTVLHQAFRCRAPHAVMEMLLQAYVKETRIDKRNRDGLTFLHIASTRDKATYLRNYLDAYETDVNAQVSLTSGTTYDGYTALHFAVAYGRYANAEILLKNDAEIHCQDVNGSTPLHLALERHDTRMIDLLLKYDKSNVNIVNDKGLSHFMAACAVGDALVVEQFLIVAETTDRKSYLHLVKSRVKDDLSHQYGGYSPLHFAAEFGQVHILHGLLAVGADPLQLSSFKMTPFMLAVKRKHANVCLFMQHHCEYACDDGFDPLNDLAAVDSATLEELKQHIDEAMRFVESDRFSDVAERCRVVNPVLTADPTRLEMAYELLNV